MSNAALVHSSDEVMHRFIWTKAEIAEVFWRPLYQDLISSDALQRLSDVRFLGAIDYFVHPNGTTLRQRRHNRLEHTLGVALLALSFAQTYGLSKADEQLLTATALLHDVGHSPLSHSLEAALRPAFGLDHHQAGIAIILGSAPSNFASSIPKILRSESIDQNEVVALLNGNSRSKYGFLFSHPINIDTIEAITRSETYINREPTSVPPRQVLMALMNASANKQILDNFWLLKDQIYRLLIQGPVGIWADFITKKYVEDHISLFSKDDYFKTERQLRRISPGVFHTLEHARTKLSSTVIDADLESAAVVQYSARRFYVDENKSSGDVARYLQNKVAKRINLKDPFATNEPIGDFAVTMPF